MTKRTEVHARCVYKPTNMVQASSACPTLNENFIRLESKQANVQQVQRPTPAGMETGKLSCRKLLAANKSIASCSLLSNSLRCNSARSVRLDRTQRCSMKKTPAWAMQASKAYPTLSTSMASPTTDYTAANWECDASHSATKNQGVSSRRTGRPLGSGPLANFQT